MAIEAPRKTVCIFCDRTDAEIAFNREHIIPQNVGGTLYLDNAVCKDCNSWLGGHVDRETLKLPDTLRAFEVLNIPHNREGILNRHYNISGESKNVELSFGKLKHSGFTFPKQRLADGRLITPEHRFFESFAEDVKRDKRVREAGLSEEEIDARLQELRSIYEKAQYDEEIVYPPLNKKLRKRSEYLSITVSSREEAALLPLIAKIAYEILYLYGPWEFFSEENRDLRTQLWTSIHRREIQNGIYVRRVEPSIKEFRPVHMIRLVFSDHVTQLKVAFFGHIQFVLTGKALSRTYIATLKDQFETEDLCAIDFQQQLDSSLKLFWTVTRDDRATYIGSL